MDMILLAKTPLGGAVSQSRYLDRRPKSSPLIQVKTNFDYKLKCLIAGFSMCYTANELTSDPQSEQIIIRATKLLDKLFPNRRVFIDLEKEVNSAISKLTDSLYSEMNHTMLGLSLMSVYLNSLDGLELSNNKPLKKSVNKQLDYMKNGETGFLLRDSQLLAQNISRLLNGGVEVSKTAEESKRALAEMAKARRVTSFEFNGEKHKVKGEHLTLEECINRFCEERYINDFYTFKSREFFMKKYGVKYENIQKS